MSEHRATVSWHRQTDAFTYQTYNRAHEWRFEGGIIVPASATPAYKGDANRVDPEKAFVASLASCHMLTFLAYAAAKKFVVDSYEDEAVGVVAKNDAGKMWVSVVTLRPKIVFSGEKRPSEADLDELHHKAHEDCFIANSVKTEVVVEPR
jgi:organic hydroperoxide reductase OsmC/OhrA